MAGLSGLVGAPRSESLDPAVKVNPINGRWRPENADDAEGGGTASDSLCTEK